MVRNTRSILAKIGSLPTPAFEELGGSLDNKAKDFFREVCRWVPWTVRNYKLDELTTASALRSNIALLFRQHAHITDPKVVDILIYKGREELEGVALQHKQRHHLISSFLKEPEMLQEALQRKNKTGASDFLHNFYQNQ